MGARRGAPPWRARQAPGGRRPHRRHAGEVREPRGVPTAAGLGDRDLRVPTDDDACKNDGGRRHVEHGGIGELRQPLPGAERRDERRRQRSRARRPAAAGLRSGSPGLAEARPGGLAAALVAGKEPRALLELLRGNFLVKALKWLAIGHTDVSYTSRGQPLHTVSPRSSGTNVPLRAKRLLIRTGCLAAEPPGYLIMEKDRPLFLNHCRNVSTCQSVAYRHMRCSLPYRPGNSIPGRRALWQRKTADSRRWIGQSSARSPARAARLRTRRARHTSGPAKRRVTPGARVELQAISAVANSPRLPRAAIATRR